nr:hypothetical protein [Bradyrhizobium amphicarpaeae]
MSIRRAEGVANLESGIDIDEVQERAERKARKSLALNPSDSFLWLMLYSVASARRGTDVGNVHYVNASYFAGPHEGWIALSRNRLGLSIFPILDPSVQQLIVSEFAELVDAGFVEIPATNLMGVGWEERERLLNALRHVDPASKKRLYKRLRQDGVKVAIPGVEEEERPWP